MSITLLQLFQYVKRRTAVHQTQSYEKRRRKQSVAEKNAEKIYTKKSLGILAYYSPPVVFLLVGSRRARKGYLLFGNGEAECQSLSAGKREEKREMKDAWREKKKGGNHSEFVPILQFLGRDHKGRECGEMLNHPPPSASKPPLLF